MNRDPLDDLFPPAEGPDPRHLERIERMVAGSLRPVRPLPSDTILIGLLLTLFCAIAIGAGVAAGLFGFHAFSWRQGAVVYLVIAICALFLSTSVVGQMIPGSKKKQAPWRAILRSLLYLAAVTLVVFQDPGRRRFIPLGIPCLLFGSICAVGAGLFMFAVVWKGFVTSYAQAGAAAGAFAGLVGIGALALHCPIRNAAHVLVWHLSVLLLGAAAGTILGIVKNISLPNSPFRRTLKI